MGFWSGKKKDPRQQQADNADAIRDVLNPKYLQQLREFQDAIRSERLRGVIERVELVARRQETPDDEVQSSDTMVINTAQQLVTALNNLAEPKLRVRYAFSPDGPTAGEVLDPETKAIRDTARELASPLKRFVPSPRLGMHPLD